MSAPLVSNADARRLFLDRHHLSTRRPGPAKPDGVARLIEELGFVQVDSIRAVERAHHHILHARLPAYRPRVLERLQKDARVFEHWTHDAALIPIAFYPYWQHVFAHYRAHIAKSAWWQKMLPGKKMIRQLLAEVEKRGPVTARDFAHMGERQGAWWGWAPHKTALEYLWFTGELAIAARDGFEKVYDLAARVIPQDHRGAKPSRGDMVHWASDAALSRLGFGSPREIAKFFDMITPEEAAKATAARADVMHVLIAGAKGEKNTPALMRRETFETLGTLPPPQKALRFINPFDPVLRDRNRARRLFGFDYTIEVFTPAAKRKYGYYVLPLLEGDRFVGRADVRADRNEDSLVIAKVWWEKGVRPARARQDALARAGERLARFCGVSKTIIHQVKDA